MNEVEDLLEAPQEHRHPKNPDLVIYGRKLKPGAIKALGDHIDRDKGWAPISPLDYGRPVPRIEGITVIRPVAR